VSITRQETITASPIEPHVHDLGRAAFADVHARMLEVAAAVADDRSAGEILLVEHEPVFTAGRATPPAELGPGILPIERGGRVTYHGPGQLVVYPIVRLPRRDVRAWLQSLEALGVAVCASFAITATASANGTGVFVGPRKVASIGVAIRRWTNLHGIAINVDMDLAGFHRVRPCGIDPQLMSDLSREASRRIGLEDAKAAVRRALWLVGGGRQSS
jgi:lipoyl(octanoyl) transferase